MKNKKNKVCNRCSAQPRPTFSLKLCVFCLLLFCFSFGFYSICDFAFFFLLLHWFFKLFRNQHHEKQKFERDALPSLAQVAVAVLAAVAVSQYPMRIVYFVMGILYIPISVLISNIVLYYWIVVLLINQNLVIHTNIGNEYDHWYWVQLFVFITNICTEYQNLHANGTRVFLLVIGWLVECIII